MDLKVVIMEAKRANAGSQGVSQALAYMGKYLTILSQCNLELTYKKEAPDTTVYGISSDSQTFIFMKLDSKSQLSPVLSVTLILTFSSGRLSRSTPLGKCSRKHLA